MNHPGVKIVRGVLKVNWLYEMYTEHMKCMQLMQRISGFLELS
jgi:hypothetical protein